MAASYYRGPTLFMVNDAADVLPAGVFFLQPMPTTPCTIFSNLFSAQECARFQAGVTALAIWGTTWWVKFELSMVPSNNHLAPPPPMADSHVYFNGLLVDGVTTLKLLGVIFDRHMIYSQHLRSTAVCASRQVGP